MLQLKKKKNFQFADLILMVLKIKTTIFNISILCVLLCSVSLAAIYF